MEGVISPCGSICIFLMTQDIERPCGSICIFLMTQDIERLRVLASH
jgi:hypothetical protein